MFSKLLIANRGEIAVRIIRACRELGIRTVAVYSEADRGALHVRMADEAFCIGPPPAADSYLNIPNIMSTAELLGVDAIHPGYGFLAENPHFAEICRDVNITFVGPSPEAIAAMGNKAAARQRMKAAGVPVIPGSDGPVRSEAEAWELARSLGFPLIVKASAGGGGRGMRIVHTREELRRALQTAQAEAEAAFGSGELYLEKYVEEPRHIEVQILADAHHNIIHLGARDCSIQRRHQKLLEESPPPGLRDRFLRALGKAAVRAAHAINYTGAGTVEFLVDRDGHFYFMEMNTRIQVEHPVTEMVTGVDIVKWQIRIAAGERLTLHQGEVEFRGHAIECRINAEDPRHDFRPAPGTLTAFVPPGGPGVRVDTHAFAGYTIPPYYDSLVAKVIAWGADRTEAIARMRRALQEFEIAGVPTTIPFHLMVLDNAFFRRGEVYTNFVQRRIDLAALASAASPGR
ncbi:MAG: acetyl-CoA carboxylase biotin carboxylase subunit [Armatimonadota bacterium]|nr:acetyl-CoA carboxylase biotin carboxylase subunit [Armatimonadota bacterium]MDR7438099.1 acetyl-CoA carboxylase biotin carboxylase subunit [Armatimonadota bacterium]MDR7471531.1 acetyl-CoA carboxylase biotin carboxylase subunit [Armatimonadota bacterium]MDR7507801.1 acetyl-CoA carboxylase biotin carboxylase subunit [Armatimonadota bacterium]MDR7509589.1 acetyl-CoA carboxylase biotin carboxylase subunit [Armatimonadota bacterium]